MLGRRPPLHSGHPVQKFRYGSWESDAVGPRGTSISIRGTA